MPVPFNCISLSKRTEGKYQNQLHRPGRSVNSNLFRCAGRSSAVLGVSQAVQDTARLHQAAKLAAAVALPPPPAATAPNMVGNVGRASVADLFTATPPVFGPTSAGTPMLMFIPPPHPSIHPSIHPFYPPIHPFIFMCCSLSVQPMPRSHDSSFKRSVPCRLSIISRRCGEAGRKLTPAAGRCLEAGRQSLAVTSQQPYSSCLLC